LKVIPIFHGINFCSTGTHPMGSIAFGKLIFNLTISKALR